MPSRWQRALDGTLEQPEGDPIMSRKQAKPFLYARQSGKCPGILIGPFARKCGRPLPMVPRGMVVDHTNPEWAGGESKLSDLALLCADGRMSCNSVKTHGMPHLRRGSDLGNKEKDDRINGRTKQGPKANIRNRSNWPKGRKIAQRKDPWGKERRAK